jgi:hypothetical protein
MADMIRYIFSSLNDTETTLRVISKSLRKQASFNRSVTFFSVTMALHLIVQEMEIRSINRDLEALQKEIKELKKTEGD